MFEGIKIFLFDIDGVLIRLSESYRKVLERRGFKNASRILEDFFRGPEYKDCVAGRRDPLKSVEPFLLQMGWERSSREFFKEEFAYDGRFLDKDFLQIIQGLRRKGHRCFLATDQDEFRREFLLNELLLRDCFDGWFVSSLIGHRKVEKQFWEFVLNSFVGKALKKEPGSVLFADDLRDNLIVAGNHGIETFHVDSEEQADLLKRELASLQA
jgi:putative hydrolase of the HAD superfamily